MKYLYIPLLIITLISSFIPTSYARTKLSSTSTSLVNNIKKSYIFSTSVINGECGLNLPILDQSCEDFTIEITGQTGVMAADVFLSEVRLIIDHTWDDDLDISLTSPAGQTIELSTDNGGNGNNYGIFSPTCDSYTSFVSNNLGNECSLTPIAEGNPPFTGMFLPEQNFSQFNIGTANGTWTLQICDDEAADVGVLQYVELFFETIECIVPSVLSTASLDSTSVDLLWEAGPNCANTQIEYGVAGFALGTGTLLSTGCPPYQIIGLNPSTTYDFYIRESCVSGGYSNYSCVSTVTTLCSPSITTIFENFNSQETCSPGCSSRCELVDSWYNVGIDDMDWNVYEVNTPTYNTGPNIDADSNYFGRYIYFETSCADPNWNVLLYSPCIDVIADVGDCHFSFNYMMNGITVNNLKVQGTTNGNQWVDLWETTGNRGPYWLKTYIDLSLYHGETMQFRFSATKSNGSLGDVALDNIAFHGPLLTGGTIYTYYEDLDLDGYGNDDNAIQSCYAVPPTGFSPDGGDCNDLVSFINPGVMDFPCDGFDQNCDPSDDNELPPPNGIGNTACSGETAPLVASPQFFGTIYWYDVPTGGTLLQTGNTFLPSPQINTTASPIAYSYYAEEIAFPGCASGQRTEFQLIINPTPQTDQSYTTDICIGDSLDLNNFPFIDQNQTAYTLSYHTSLPPNSGNQLSSSVVTPTNNSVYFIVATTANGCFDIIPLAVNINTAPMPDINGSPSMCIGSSQILSVSDQGVSDAPYSYIWTTGDTLFSTEINATTTNNTTSYIVSMTGNNGCTALDTFDVLTTGNLSPVSVTSFEVSSCNGTDGQLLLNPNSGVPPYTYSWEGPTMGSATSNSSSNLALTNLKQGAYTITVSDASGGSGCTTVIPYAIVNGPAAIVEIDAIEGLSCYGAEDGKILLSTFGNNPTFEWNTGETTEDLQNLSKGNYSLTVTDGNCESLLPNIFVPEPDTLVVKPFAFANETCADSEDGSISLIVIGGTPSYDLTWSTGLSTTSIDNLDEGQYTLTVTDQNNCIGFDTFYINAPNEISVSLLLKENISCIGKTDGSIKIDVTGGTAPYSYFWNNGSTLRDPSDLEKGIYAVTVTDFKGCSVVLDNIEIIEPSPIVFSNALLNEPNCFGSSSGLISLQISGGTPHVSTNNTPLYDIIWSNGATTPANFNLTAGSYSVTVSDARGCSILDTFILDAPIALAATFNSQPASCYGMADGHIFLNSITPTPSAPLSYEWSNGNTVANNQNLVEGNYTVTITDEDNCTFTKTIEVLANQPIVTNVNINHPNCNSQATGEITVDVFGSVPPYQYQWSNSQTAEEENPDLVGGFYNLTITTDNNCYKILDSIQVIEPDSILFEVVSIDSVICNGTATGNIELNITGGQAPYYYTWNGDGALEEDLFDVDAGVYTLNVTDENFCSVNQTFEVLEALPLTVVADIPPENLDNCSGIAVDSLPLILNGGQPPYTINWSTGETTPTIYNVVEGEYYATITDARGCQVEHFSKINSAIEILEVLEKDTVITTNCGSSNNTTFCVEIEGGLPPFIYLWDDALLGVTSDRTLCRTLPFGTHSVTVTDANSCITVLEEVNLNYVTPLNIYMSESGKQDVDCFGSANGSIDATITGGALPYIFYWEKDNIPVDLQGNPTPNSLNNLTTGTYALTVTDQRNCSVTGSWEITEPSSLVNYSLTNISHISCYGDMDGEISIAVTGGTPPYDFEWTNGATAEDIQSLNAGFYGLTITDANNCIRILDTMTFEIVQPQSALINSSTQIENISCNGVVDGYILLDVTGGTAPYLFDWSFQNAADSDEVFNAPEGLHSCEIFDSNGCLLEVQDIPIVEPTLIETSIEINEPIFGSVSVVDITGGTPFSNGSYAINWSNGDIGWVGNDFPIGQHSVVITDSQGCSNTHFFIINPTAIEDIILIEKYSLYPNPTNGKAFFYLELKESADARIDVFNLLGQKIISQSKTDLTTGNFELDFTGFASGIYFLNLFVEEKFAGSLRVVVGD